MRVCHVCGKGGNLHKHHIIYKDGKKKAWETRESLIDICFTCHEFVHSIEGAQLNMVLKEQLQATYLAKGYDEETVRKLMAGKLVKSSENADEIQDSQGLFLN